MKLNENFPPARITIAGVVGWVLVDNLAANDRWQEIVWTRLITRKGRK